MGTTSWTFVLGNASPDSMQSLSEIDEGLEDCDFPLGADGETVSTTWTEVTYIA